MAIDCRRAYRKLLAVRDAVHHVLFEFFGYRQPHHSVVHVLVIGFHVLVQLKTGKGGKNIVHRTETAIKLNRFSRFADHDQVELNERRPDLLNAPKTIGKK